MKIKNLFIIIFCIFAFSCADYQSQSIDKKKEKNYFSSSGFALIYSKNLFDQKIVNKKINNEKNEVLHSSLKINTPIKIINPLNSKFVETKIKKKAEFPKIFSLVISKEIANILELNEENPFVEIVEVKKNEIFVAKKSNTFDEEKHVAAKVPVDEIQMDDISVSISNNSNSNKKKNKFILVINDFYYQDSAISLKNEILKQTKLNNLFVKKINDKKYRLFAGPFENFNALKNSYISLNNLGFEDLNIYVE
tara:strand:+ start:15432 stop:16184 length:753 start_codon:yes stop_codon:yes gene_type:complete